jgi:hypothetical protein
MLGLKKKDTLTLDEENDSIADSNINLPNFNSTKA